MDLNSLYESLSPLIIELENEKKIIVRKFLIKFSIALFVTLALLVTANIIVMEDTRFFNEGILRYFFIGGFVLSLTFTLGFYSYFKSRSSAFKIKFKQTIIAPLIKNFTGNFQYDPSPDIDIEDVYRLNIFRIDKWQAEDYLLGEINGNIVEIVELKIEEEVGYSSKSSNRRYKTVFNGLFLKCTMKKSVPSPIYITREKFKSAILTKIKSLFVKQISHVQFDEPEFEKYFDVMSDDEINTRATVNSLLRQKLLELRNMAHNNLYLVFIENLIFGFIPIKEKIFEPRMFSSNANAGFLDYSFRIYSKIIELVKTFS